jgi:hypothetical protein
MGEAKRKRLALCRCGSGYPAARCCLISGTWHKRPVTLELRNTGEVGTHNRCYLHSTGACSTKISSEHMISESVLRVLAEKNIEISGPRWLNGQSKVLGFAALTTKCLCTAHNSRLSPIDAAGAQFFEAIQKCGTTEVGPEHTFMLSGHDIERWMLRSLAALGVSKNLAIDGAVIDQEFVNRLGIVGLLEDVAKWTRPLGLYLVQGIGHQFTRRNTLDLAPLVRDGSDEIVGILMNIQGFEIALIAGDHDITGTGLEKALYRPGALIFEIGKVRHTIQMSWEDGLDHTGVTIGLKK